MMCAVSSMDRVADFESVGWGFESLTACQNNPPKERLPRFAGGFFARDAQEHEMRLASSSNVQEDLPKVSRPSYTQAFLFLLSFFTKRTIPTISSTRTITTAATIKAILLGCFKSSPGLLLSISVFLP